ncbi:MAG: response regulator [Candidatus Omnitrophota bacterium]|nr:response regulator [Nanoarchaeota archaeon]MBU1083908.1 response regulator [Candidatus Omnitrophota bacterium]
MPKKILIIDDEPHIIMMVKSRLRANGFDVVTAENGAAGFETAKKEKPDLIILDVLMPEMNGIETLTKLKNTDETKDIPVIMFTAKGQAEDVEKAQEAGACDYLVKPFSPPILLEKVTKALT